MISIDLIDINLIFYYISTKCSFHNKVLEYFFYFIIFKLGDFKLEIAKLLHVGIVGSGRIGTDLGYGFLIELWRREGSLILVDKDKKALAKCLFEIRQYLNKAVKAKVIKRSDIGPVLNIIELTPDIKTLKNCQLVFEAATEDKEKKKGILKSLEAVVHQTCIIATTTSGIPRSELVAEATHPDRYFILHPFTPAWRSIILEMVSSGDAFFEATAKKWMTLFGKLVIPVKDVPLFAGNRIITRLMLAAFSILEESIATMAEIDAAVHDMLQNGGVFNVMNRIGSNAVIVECIEKMIALPEIGSLFSMPQSITKQAENPWDVPAKPEKINTVDSAIASKIKIRILVALAHQASNILEEGICSATHLNFITKYALNFGGGKKGLLEMLQEIGKEQFALSLGADGNNFQISEKVWESLFTDLNVEKDTQEITTITVVRPETKNALRNRTIEELHQVYGNLTGKSAIIKGFAYDLAGADIDGIKENAQNPEMLGQLSDKGQQLMLKIWRHSVPTIGISNGFLIGGGAELLLCTRARFFGKKVQFAMREITLAIGPGYCGFVFLIRLLGALKALEVITSGNFYNAEQALAMGLCHSVSDDPEQAARELIISGQIPEALPDETIKESKISLSALANILQGFSVIMRKNITEGTKEENQTFSKFGENEDTGEGLLAFLEKRKPNFTHN